MIYVISDIHGCFYTMKALLRKIDYQPEEDRLYILGDMIDQGNYSLEVLDYLFGLSNCTIIRGNHEEFYRMYYEKKMRKETWIKCGGRSTLEQMEQLSDTERLVYYHKFSNLPFGISITVNGRQYYLTHSGYYAGVKSICDKHGITKVEESVLKMFQEAPLAYLCSGDLHHIPNELKFDKKLIVGHIITYPFTGKNEIMRTSRYVDIDCGAAYLEQGKLAALRLDDEKAFYMEKAGQDIR